MISALAMAIWLSAGLFHPVMQPHTQPDSALTDGLTHDHVLLDDHPLCPFCFGILALPSVETTLPTVQVPESDEPKLRQVDPLSNGTFTLFSNRAPPLSIG